MLKIVVNSTPLIILCAIDCLSLLQKLYHEILIPEAVFREVTAKKDSACNQLLKPCDWIRVVPVKDTSEKKMFKAKLHEGEVEVMILAEEQKADLLIIDDNAAKRTAKYLGFNVTGSLGILVKARQEGLIGELKPILTAMKNEGFYIGPDIEAMVLKQVGE